MSLQTKYEYVIIVVQWGMAIVRYANSNKQARCGIVENSARSECFLTNAKHVQKVGKGKTCDRVANSAERVNQDVKERCNGNPIQENYRRPKR